MDAVVLCGVQRVDFTDRQTKQRIEGTSVFYQVKIPEAYGSGTKTEKVFIRRGTVSDDFMSELAPGKKVAFYWNQFGKLVSAEFVK